jgi:hypothetical protein
LGSRQNQHWHQRCAQLHVETTTPHEQSSIRKQVVHERLSTPHFHSMRYVPVLVFENKNFGSCKSSLVGNVMRVNLRSESKTERIVVYLRWDNLIGILFKDLFASPLVSPLASPRFLFILRHMQFPLWFPVRQKLQPERTIASSMSS